MTLKWFTILLASLILWWMSVATGVAQDHDIFSSAQNNYIQQLQRVRVLIRANVLGLAEEILESNPPPIEFEEQRIRWEKQLWAIYKIKGDWQSLLDRSSQTTEGFPAEFLQLAQVEKANALMALGRGKDARKVLRTELLDSANTTSTQRDFRKLLVQSYLADGLLTDAATAMMRYQNDYRNPDEDWLETTAKLYYRLNDYDSAINVLAPLNGANARLLRLFFRVENQSIDFSTVKKIAYGILQREQDGKLKTVKKYQVLSVILAAIQRVTSADVWEEKIQILEQYLVARQGFRQLSSEPYPSYDWENLYSAYDSYAIFLANQAGLLQGDFDTLFQYGLNLPAEKKTQKRAVFGYLLKNGGNMNNRPLLKSVFAITFLESKYSSLLPILFSSGQPFGEISLSSLAGLLLSNQAVQQGDFKLAAWVNQYMGGIPSNMAKDEWYLHAARISVIAGKFAQGQKNLLLWLTLIKKPAPDQIDEFLQPVFDLQAAGQHKLAIVVLEALNRKLLSARHTREMAFWLAESYQAEGQLLKAADYFLHSALLKEDGFDQWGAAAKFRAAESLLEAGIVQDARTLFQDLYNHSTEESRKMALFQKLQEVSLRESKLARNNMK